jgi:hypothetical protein
MNGITFSVTMVRPGPWPSVEVAAYEYVGTSLPSVGERIDVRKVGGGEELRGYVTRVVPSAMTPISVTEVAADLLPNETSESVA